MIARTPLHIGAGGLVEVILPDIPIVRGETDIVVRQTLQDYMDLAASTLAGAVQEKAPVGVSGGLRQSITYDVAFTSPTDIHGRVFSSLPYAKVVDEGRRPGPISRAGIASIGLWVRRKLGLHGREASSAMYAIAAKIRREGFAGQHFLRDGFEATRPQLDTLFAAMAEEITARLAGQRGDQR